MTTDKYLRKIWVVSNQSDTRNKKLNQMLPDGCLEIIFVRGRGFKLTTLDDTFSCTEGIYLGGQLTGPIYFEILLEMSRKPHPRPKEVASFVLPIRAIINMVAPIFIRRWQWYL